MQGRGGGQQADLCEIWGKTIPGIENSQCKGPKTFLSCLDKSKKAYVAGLWEAGDECKEMRSDGGMCLQWHR